MRSRSGRWTGPGDLGWVLMAHGERYAARVRLGRRGGDGADRRRPRRRPSPGRDAGWIAELDGVRVGSVLCVRAGRAHRPPAPAARSTPPPAATASAARLVTCCVDFARDAGYARLVLWTNEPLAAARHLYLDAGFTLTGEERHREFGDEVLGQSYALDLAPPDRRTPHLLTVL